MGSKDSVAITKWKKPPIATDSSLLVVQVVCLWSLLSFSFCFSKDTQLLKKLTTKRKKCAQITKLQRFTASAKSMPSGVSDLDPNIGVGIQLVQEILCTEQSTHGLNLCEAFWSKLWGWAFAPPWVFTRHFTVLPKTGMAGIF